MTNAVNNFEVWKPLTELAPVVSETASIFQEWNPFLGEGLPEETGLAAKIRQVEQRERELEQKAQDLNAVEKNLAVRESELANLNTNLKQVINELTEEKKKIMEASASDIIDIAFEMASRVMMKEVAEDPVPLVKNLQLLLREEKPKGRVTIRLSEDDFKMMNACMNVDVIEFMKNENLNFISSPELLNGQARVDAHDFRYDISFVDSLLKMKPGDDFFSGDKSE